MKTERKKTIVILIPGFPSDELDSTCLPAQQAFVLALKKQYPETGIAVVTFQYPFRSDHYQWNHIPVISLNGRNRRGWNRIKVWMLAWRALRQLKKENEIVGLFSFWCTECALVGKWFAKYFKLKHYCWLFGQDAKKENGFVKFVKPTSTELIALSDFLVDEFEKNHHVRPSHVIPCVVDTAAFPPLEGERTIDLIGVGSLIPMKQYEIFVSVVKELVKRNPNLKAVICGKGPERDSLQDLIDKHSLQENIRLAGEIPNQEVLRLMQQSKILVHPSSYEGFGGVCLEALYAGTHVVSFVHPMKEKIPHWHITDSKTAMTEKIMEILDNPQTNHERVLPFPVEKAAKTFMNLLID
jgi:glycosyltransferase involved in cell wall biosynthesis